MEMEHLLGFSLLVNFAFIIIIIFLDEKNSKLKGTIEKITGAGVHGGHFAWVEFCFIIDRYRQALKMAEEWKNAGGEIWKKFHSQKYSSNPYFYKEYAEVVDEMTKSGIFSRDWEKTYLPKYSDKELTKLQEQTKIDFNYVHD